MALPVHEGTRGLAPLSILGQAPGCMPSKENPMKSKQKNNSKNKKIYKKPGLRIIQLETDQVLAVGCKLTSGGSAIGVTPCIASFCAQDGS